MNQTITPATAPARIRSIRLPPSAIEAVTCTIAPDMAGRRRREMRADHQHRLVSPILEQRLPCDACGFRVVVEGRRPFRMRDLARMVHHVPRDHGGFPAR